MDPVLIHPDVMFSVLQRQRNAALDAAANEWAADIARRDQRITELEVALEQARGEIADLSEQLIRAGGEEPDGQQEG